MEREAEERIERLENSMERAWRAIEFLAGEQTKGFSRMDAEFARLTERMDAEYARTQAQFRQTDERIEKLVRAIGELIRWERPNT
jgi:hypothetical protein